MKYILPVALSLLIGFFGGVQYSYYQARKMKEEFKAAVIDKAEQKYEDVKQKLKKKITGTD